MMGVNVTNAQTRINELVECVEQAEEIARELSLELNQRIKQRTCCCGTNMFVVSSLVEGFN